MTALRNESTPRETEHISFYTIHLDSENKRTNSTAMPFDRCMTALAISHQPILIALTVISILCCIVGVTSAVLLSYYLYKKPVYHINIRLLLWNMCLALSLGAIGVCYLSVDHLVTFVIYQDQPCRMVVSYSWCHTQRSAAMILPAFEVANSAVALAFERGYATACYCTYETRQARHIGVGLIGVQWLIGSSPAIATYIKRQTDQRTGTMPFCISLLITPSASVGVIISLLFDLFSVVFILLLLYINSGKRQKQVNVQFASVNDGHLSRRYQLKENLRSTRMLIPCLCAHTLMNALSAIVTNHIAAGQLGNDNDVARLAVYNELASLIISLYAPTFCITCMVQSPQLFAYVRTRWACLPSPTTVSVQQPTGNDANKIRLQQLNAAWGGEEKPKRK